MWLKGILMIAYPLNHLYVTFKLPLMTCLKIAFRPVLVGTWSNLLKRPLDFTRFDHVANQASYPIELFELLFVS